MMLRSEANTKRLKASNAPSRAEKARAVGHLRARGHKRIMENRRRVRKAPVASYLCGWPERGRSTETDGNANNPYRSARFWWRRSDGAGYSPFEKAGSKQASHDDCPAYDGATRASKVRCVLCSKLHA